MLNVDVVSAQDSGEVALLTVESSEVSWEVEGQLMSRLKELTTEGHATRVVIDLSRVTFLGSVGIGILLRASKLVCAVNAKLVLAGLAGHCRNVLEVCGLEKVFVLHEDVSSALKAFRRVTGRA